jgi:molybdenum cofactor biosynthesis enzyme MoaA
VDTTTVSVNGVCNARCAFCSLPGGRLDDARAAAARAQLAADREAGASTARFGGGEPLLEAGLGELVAHARALGYESIVLETNATVASRAGVAEALVAAGVTDVLWSLNAPSADGDDATYGLAGAHGAAVAGARAFVAAGARVVARTPLTVVTAATLDAIPAWLVANVEGIAGWWLRPLGRRGDPRFDLALLPTVDGLGAAIDRGVRAARRAGLPVRVDDTVGVPLCAFQKRPAALRVLDQRYGQRLANHRAAPGCVDCAAASACPKTPAEYVAAGASEPTVVPYVRFDATALSRTTRQERYVVYDRTTQEGQGATGAHVTIRVVMPCNQACVFCFVDRTSPGLDDAAILAAIDAAAAAGAERVSLSGGEPTIHPRLADFVARAAANRIREREIQTNALTLADPAVADRLVAAGLTQAVVSLHAVDPVRYLAITAAGTPEQALQGVANLLARGVAVELNVVHTRDNLDHLEAVVETVAARVPDVQVLFSVTYIVDGLPRAWDDIALRYTESAPHLARAMRRARDLGLRYRLTGRCGLPPCAWGEDLPELFSFAPPTVDDEVGGEGQVYFDDCGRCAARGNCYGVPEAYAARFGGGELRPIGEADWAAARGLAAGG